MSLLVVVRHALSRCGRPLQWIRTRRRTPFGKFQIQQLEERVNFSVNVASYDGTGNNLLNTDWGSAGSDLLRLSPAQYADGVSTPAGADRPSARAISNAVSANPDQAIINDRDLTAFVYAWGQFLDHDLDLTVAGSPKESFNVAVPSGDPQFDPNGTGTQQIFLSRSQFDPNTGISAANPRQQVNTISAFLDGSQIYGSDAVRAAALRTFSGGHLKTSDGNQLPLNADKLPNANDAHLVADDKLYLAGDVRANENIELLSMHTLFVREHNRIADQIAKANPSFNDEQIFQRARTQVIAELQVITYREFLPALLGPTALKAYTGYHSDVNPGISNEFSTAAFRLGHSMLGDDIEFLDNNGKEIAPAVELRNAFFNPSGLQANGIDSILKYLASDRAQELDTRVVDDVRNFLFGPPGAGGFDLASLNIQRGRDHGLADYNTMRAAYGLPKVTTFADITPDKNLQAQLQKLYGSVDKIDAWVGGLAEKHVPGSSVGALFQRILVDQFTRLRDGDRFWYQNSFSKSQLQQIERTTLADVIRRNTDVTNLQPNVFVLKTSISGTVFNDVNQDGKRQQGDVGLAGIMVRLLDDAGAMLQTTRTDAQGNYHFTGLDLGDYSVRETVPSGAKNTSAVKVDASITKGMDVRADFGLMKLGAAPAAPKPTQPPPARPAAPRPMDPQHLAMMLSALAVDHDEETTPQQQRPPVRPQQPPPAKPAAPAPKRTTS
jgi:peroxidase